MGLEEQNGSSDAQNCEMQCKSSVGDDRFSKPQFLTHLKNQILSWQKGKKMSTDAVVVMNCPDSTNRRIDEFSTNENKSVSKLCSMYALTSLQFWATFSLLGFSSWAVLFIWFDELALPSGPIFSLFVLLVFAIILGHTTEYVGLPPMLGMILTGIIYRNTNISNLTEWSSDLDMNITSPLRAMSVVVLLIKGALSVDFPHILKYQKIVLPLAIGGCCTEAIVGVLLFRLITGLPWPFAAALGCQLSAMSGVGVTPYLTRDLKRSEKYPKSLNVAENKNCSYKVVHMALTGSGLDAVLAIIFTESSFGFIFAKGDIQTGLIRGICEVFLGVGFGIVWGTFCGVLLADKDSGKYKMTMGLFCGGVMSLLGLTKLGFPRGGPPGIFTGALIAITIWRHQKHSHTEAINLINDDMNCLWYFFQPLLFSICSSRINFWEVNWNLVLLGLVSTFVAFSGRLLYVFLASQWTNLTTRQRLYLVLAWMPKGTLQAALCPVALETAIGLDDSSLYQHSYEIMYIVTSSICIYSLVGPIFLRCLGSRLLEY